MEERNGGEEQSGGTEVMSGEVRFSYEANLVSGREGEMLSRPLDRRSRV
jgi:hypothetical protein